jgi:hypothetical protein
MEIVSRHMFLCYLSQILKQGLPHCEFGNRGTAIHVLLHKPKQHLNLSISSIHQQ